MPYAPFTILGLILSFLEENYFIVLLSDQQKPLQPLNGPDFRSTHWNWDLVEGIHGEEGDPGDAELLDDGVGHGGLAARAPAADSDDERLNQLTLPIVPEQDDGINRLLSITNLVVRSRKYSSNFKTLDNEGPLF